MDWYIAFTNTVLIFVSLYIAILLFRAQAEAQNRSDERLRQLTQWQALHSIKQREIPDLILKGREILYSLPFRYPESIDQQVIEWKVDVETKLHLFIKDWYRVFPLCKIDPYLIENYEAIEDDLFASLNLLSTRSFPQDQKEFNACVKSVRKGVDLINRSLGESIGEEPKFSL